MTLADYRRALDAAVREYEQALAERTALDGRLAQLQQTINTLSRLCGLQPTVPWGLTDACRTILRNAARPLTAIEVRDRLASIGFDLGRYANPLAAIHTVLKRLTAAGDVSAGDRRGAVRAVYALPGGPAVGRPAGATSPAGPRRRSSTKAGPR
jgi:hypothetical protein